MAVPASGTITMFGIYQELTNALGYTVSIPGRLIKLSELSDGSVQAINTSGNKSSNRPDGSAPHTMSEFYSYDHDA